MEEERKAGKREDRQETKWTKMTRVKIKQVTDTR